MLFTLWHSISLLKQGYSMTEIVQCTLEVLEIQERRSDSVRNRKWDGLNNFMEVTKRAMKRKKSSRRLQREQQLVLGPPARPRSNDDMPLTTPRMRRPNRRRSLELTSTTATSEQQDQPNEMQKIRTKAPRRRSTLMVDESMMNRTWAMSA
mmetsp:Transcript_1638/g.3467  ORF Transcript_1638/g.3467 Transcript_1638/m.3467 type:complete len:151 (-) Transcript_1638:1611-2063(-)